MADEGDLESKFQQLLARRGQDLVRGLIDEIADLHREIAELRRELGALGDYQAMRDRWLTIGGETSRTVRLPRLVVVEPTLPMRTSDGFYPLEHTGGGIAFRWTGPSAQFSFNVFVDRSRGADLRLETINCMDAELQKNLGLLVDGESVPVEISQEETAFTVTAALPAHDDGRSTNLVFVLPAVLSPPESADTRLLGVAFTRLTVAARTEAGIAPELAPAAQDAPGA
ncbi:MAG TPA: hypothetical protein VHZ29_14035 [Rhizomicrobium sp.]|jgi:hypothetical protein|nr:hypothetical protein [Rhizomicrobium sp.]